MSKKKKWIPRINRKLRSIYVTELDNCFKKVQFREIMNLPQDPLQFETYRGIYVHKLFEKIAKMPPASKLTRTFWKEMWEQQVLIPLIFRGKLRANLPLYEERIKRFFLKDKQGKKFFKAGISNVEDSIRCPVSAFGLNLKFPKSVLKKYEVSGRPDFRVGKWVIEVKSGKTKTPIHSFQGFVYKKILEALDPKIKTAYRLLYLGQDNPTIQNISKWYSFAAKRKKNQERLRTSIIEQIENWEKLEIEPYGDFERKRGNRCTFCSYHTQCLSTKATWHKNYFKKKKGK